MTHDFTCTYTWYNFQIESHYIEYEWCHNISIRNDKSTHNSIGSFDTLKGVICTTYIKFLGEERIEERFVCYCILKRKFTLYFWLKRIFFLKLWKHNRWFCSFWLPNHQVSCYICINMVKGNRWVFNSLKREFIYWFVLLEVTRCISNSEEK